MPIEKRQHPRYEVLAQVELANVEDGEILVFTATNLSVAGMFFEAKPSEHPELAPGKRFAVSLSLPQRADERTPPPPIEVRCMAKLIRRDDARGGFGVCFEEIDPTNLARLRALIAHVSR